MRFIPTFLTCLILGLGLVLVACPSDDDDDDSSAGDDDDATAGDDDDATDDDDDDDAASDPCESAEAARADALANGIVVANGVAIEEADDMGDILADMPGYEGQVVQIEGSVVELCASQGCWALLEDLDGDQIKLKATDGVVDWRTVAEIGVWAVGEGTFTNDPSPDHGAMVFVLDHGAMVGTTVCDF